MRIISSLNRSIRSSLKSELFVIIGSTTCLLAAILGGFLIVSGFYADKKNLTNHYIEAAKAESGNVTKAIYRAIGVTRTLSMTVDYMMRSSNTQKDSILIKSINNLTERLSFYNGINLYNSYFYSFKASELGEESKAQRKIYFRDIKSSYTKVVDEQAWRTPEREACINHAESSKKAVMSAPYYDNQELLVSIAAPIEYEGRVVGSAGVEIPLKEIQKTIAKMHITGGEKIYLFATNGTLVASSTTSLIGSNLEKVAKDNMLEELCQKIIQNTDNSPNAISGTKDRNTYFACPIIVDQQNQTWSLCIEIPNKILYKKTAEQGILGLLVAIGLVGIVLLLTNRFASKVSDPILELSKAINKLSTGDIKSSQNINITSESEIGQIQQSVNVLLDSFRRTTSFANEIGNGNYEVEYELQNTNDDLGQSLIGMKRNLIEAKNQEAERQKQEQLNNWFNEGVAKFAEILRSNNDNIQGLSFQVLKNLVSYVNAIQGGIFVLEEESKTLNLAACYAYDRRKQLDKSFTTEEGLVGRCFQEGERIYLTEIPQGYMNITSGLGETKPSCMLLVPLKVNGQILGVIELAALNAIEEHKIKFIEKVSESIAATLIGVNTNIRTNALLEKTKIQAEEMAAAEEEMRQNLEELQSTQEEMNRIQQDQKHAIEEGLQNTELINILLAATDSLVLVKDKVGKIIQHNHPSGKMELFTDRLCVGCTYADIFSMETAAKQEQVDDSVILQGCTIKDADYSLEVKDGDTISVKAKKIPLSINGSIQGLVTIFG